MIRILTDSATDFTQEELQKLNVRCVPMTIAFGGDTYTDGVDLPQEIFWQRMEAGQTPKTSQPSPDAFLREFEAAKAAGDSVLCVLVSSALSGTLQSALIAVGMTEDLDVALVDSLSATVGERLLVQEACRMRDAGGKTAQEIAEALRLLVPRVRIFACLDTLEYLARGGRIPKAVADVGMLVKLKPLVTVSPDGLVAMAGKAIGRHRAGDAIMKLMERHPIDPRYPLIPLYTGGRGKLYRVPSADRAGGLCLLHRGSGFHRPDNRLARRPRRFRRGVYFCINVKTPRHSRGVYVIPFFRSP